MFEKMKNFIEKNPELFKKISSGVGAALGLGVAFLVIKSGEHENFEEVVEDPPFDLDPT